MGRDGEEVRVNVLMGDEAVKKAKDIGLNRARIVASRDDEVEEDDITLRIYICALLMEAPNVARTSLARLEDREIEKRESVRENSAMSPLAPVVTGLYYRSPELVYFLLTFPVYSHFVLLAVVHVVKARLNQLRFLF